MRALRWLPGVVLLLPWLLAPLAPSNEARIRDLASPSGFRLLAWETVHIAERAGRLVSGLLTTQPEDTASLDEQVLRTYFAGFRGQQTPSSSLRKSAEQAVERAVSRAYREAGVAHPGERLFPPVLVTLAQPPNILVIAPRSELRVISSSVLQAMDVPAQERLENSADSTGVSSLVAPIGGLATYPSMVLEDSSAERVLSSAAHEWLHQYLIFYPLGAGYWNSQETREINETTAEMVGQEVGLSLARTLMLDEAPSPLDNASPRGTEGFDFRAFMRETRATTETLLSEGQIDAAEAHMRARRDELSQHGYQIRKLNQAYFALYGSYSEGFAASPANPIPRLLRQLRDQSATLGDFVVQVRGITNLAELRRASQTALPA